MKTELTKLGVRGLFWLAVLKIADFAIAKLEEPDPDLVSPCFHCGHEDIDHEHFATDDDMMTAKICTICEAEGRACIGAIRGFIRG